MKDREYITPKGDEGVYSIDTASWRTERPVMDKNKCIECGMCFVYCPVSAIKVDEDGKYKTTYEYCKGCGVCRMECPKDAIAMLPEEQARKEGRD